LYGENLQNGSTSVSSIILHTPFGLEVGPLTGRVSLISTFYEVELYDYHLYSPDDHLLFFVGMDLSLARVLFFDFHLEPDFNPRYSLGLTSERLSSIPFELSLGLTTFRDNSYEFIGIEAGIGYTFGNKSQSKVGSGPSSSAKGQAKGGVIERPGSTGSPEIDNFVTAAFDLNDKIVDLKEKVESVSSGLSESNKVLAAIGSSSSGPVGWALKELTKGFSKSKNSITSAVESLKSEVPDLPEIYFNLIKESMTDPNTLQELLKGTEPEEALVLTFNKKAKEKGVPTTSKDWVKSLNLELDPTKALKTKLGKINDGVMGGKDKLVSIPDDLKAIGEQAQSLLGSAKELPKAAKSLGFSKAPAALKAIKATTGVLKNIPNEVTAIGDETKKVAEEIEEVLNNIKNIIS